MKKIQPVLVVNNSYKYIKGRYYISDHVIPLAIGLPKGISWVGTYKPGLLLFNRVSSNYWTEIPGEKNTDCYGF